MSACLDSWALIAWLDGEEPALGRVDERIGDEPAMSWVSVAEAYHRVERDHGRAAAARGLTLLTGDPEIIDRAAALPCPVEDLRPPARRRR